MNSIKNYTRYLLLGLALLPLNLFAHSFDIAIIAAFGTDQGPSLWNGMRVATRERDGHVYETSDGHLGGVDSQLVRFDTANESDALLARLLKIGEVQGFIIAVLMKADQELLAQIPENIPYIAILVDGDAVNSNSNLLQPKQIQGNGRQIFQENYVDQYQRPPTEAALAGYTAARLIDAAIRQTDGDFTHSKAVQQAFMQSIQLLN